MIEIGGRIAGLILAALLIWAAFRIHKAGGTKTSWAGIAFGLLAGLALLGAIAAEWLTGLMGIGDGIVGLGFLLFTLITIAADLLVDRKPDKPALIAVIAFPLAIWAGIGQLDQIPDLAGDGAGRVEASYEQAE